MSRSFNGTSDYLEHGAAVVGAVPITMACWYKAVVTGTVPRALMYLGDSAATTRLQLYWSNTRGGAAVAVDVSGGSAEAIVTTLPTPGIWQHVCGVFASTTDRRAFFAGSKATNATSVVLGTPTATTLGARYSAAVRGSFMLGHIAEAAIWDVALDDTEVYLLSRGNSPDQIRPGSLKAYWPLTGQYSPDEIDVKGRFDATVFGATPARADYPPMIPRTGRVRVLDFAALPPGPPAVVDMVPARRQSYQQAVNR